MERSSLGSPTLVLVTLSLQGCVALTILYVSSYGIGKWKKIIKVGQQILFLKKNQYSTPIQMLVALFLRGHLTQVNLYILGFW